MNICLVLCRSSFAVLCIAFEMASGRSAFGVHVPWTCSFPFSRIVIVCIPSPIARFMGPTWGPSGADRTQVGPMLAPWTLLSGFVYQRIVLCQKSILLTSGEMCHCLDGRCYLDYYRWKMSANGNGNRTPSVAKAMNLVAKGLKEGKYFKHEIFIFLSILWLLLQWLLQNV